MPIDGILIGKHSLRKSLTDDNDRFFALAVELIEVAALDDRNTERGKKAGEMVRNWPRGSSSPVV